MRHFGGIRRALVGIGVASVALFTSTGLASAAEVDSVAVDSDFAHGFEQVDCQSAQGRVIRIESDDFVDTGVCFQLTGDRGWQALRVTGSYGIFNTSDTDVTVGVSSPAGNGYWQRVASGGVTNVQSAGQVMTVVELQYGDVAKIEPANSTLTPGKVVSLYNVDNKEYLRAGYYGVKGGRVTPGDSLSIRVSASYEVTPALSGAAGCVSLRSLTGKDLYLRKGAGQPVVVAPVDKGSEADATWCGLEGSVGSLRNQASNSSLGWDLFGMKYAVGQTWASSWRVVVGLAKV